MSKYTLVDKVNKGSSRDEWGTLHYHSYKSRNGAIRARISKTESGSYLLEVKDFSDPKAGRWNSRTTWEYAPAIGSSYVELTEWERGLKSPDALKEINALVEVHNDNYDAQIDRMVQIKDYNGVWSPDAGKVEAFSVNFDEAGVMSLGLGVKMSTTYSSGLREVLDKDTRPWTPDAAADLYTGRLADLRAKLTKDLKMLERIEEAVSTGTAIEGFNSYADTGYTGTDTQRLVDAANELIQQVTPVEATV